MKKHNFSAGPAILPAPVIAQAAEAITNFNGTGLSILEVSHRGKEFMAALEEAIQLPKDLLGLGDDFEVLYLTGGASTQFYQVPMNLLNEDESAGYVNTGTWADKAIKEAKLFGNIEVLASSKEQNYTFIPKGFDIPSHLKYLHLTSNNTIFGTQYKEFPKTDIPLVCDMSSDFLSRPVDASRFGLIYAGAQKNLGPAGTTLVIIRKDMLGKSKRKLPLMLDYNTHIKDQSSHNTPPVFPIYVCLLTLRWIKENGGLAGMAKHNEEKGAILYNEIDRNPLFVGTTAKEDRSLMNATFVMNDPTQEEEFMKLSKAEGFIDIKGHRSVGGFRASMYNAMPKSDVQALADLMRHFAQIKG